MARVGLPVQRNQAHEDAVRNATSCPTCRARKTWRCHTARGRSRFVPIHAARYAAAAAAGVDLREAE